MSQEKNIPKRRFEEFQDAPAWEQRKLESMATFSKGCGYSKSDLIDSGHEVILYGRLYTSYETVISSVNTYVELNDKSVISVGGEVIVPASGESPEDIARASVVEKEGVALGGDLNIIRPKSSLDSVFLALSISNGSQKKELSKRAQGKSVVHLHNSDLKEVIILYPKVEEQSKISDLFISFDSLISLHQRKLDKLRALKESYLSKMFPAEGENKPELRFKGYTDAWEQRKLGDMGKVSMCKRVFKSETSEIGEVPFYKIGTFGEVADSYISKDLFEEYRDKYSYPKVGDILISASGSIGRTVVYTGQAEYFQDSNIVWLDHGGKIDNRFLLAFYAVVKWSGIEGSTIKRLYNDNILNTQISLPSLSEQATVGNFFRKFDSLISLHQRKLDKLKALKEAYLSEMFV